MKMKGCHHKVLSSLVCKMLTIEFESKFVFVFVFVWEFVLLVTSVKVKY